jgi:hypothetical protein
MWRLDAVAHQPPLLVMQCCFKSVIALQMPQHIYSSQGATTIKDWLFGLLRHCRLLDEPAACPPKPPLYLMNTVHQGCVVVICSSLVAPCTEEVKKDRCIE